MMMFKVSNGIFGLSIDSLGHVTVLDMEGRRAVA